MKRASLFTASSDFPLFWVPFNLMELWWSDFSFLYFIFPFLFSIRYKVQVTKPSTALKLKTNFLSLLTADDTVPFLKDLKVSVVRNSQIISIMVMKIIFLFRQLKLIYLTLWLLLDFAQKASLLASYCIVMQQIEGLTLFFLIYVKPEATNYTDSNLNTTWSR